MPLGAKDIATRNKGATRGSWPGGLVVLDLEVGGWGAGEMPSYPWPPCVNAHGDLFFYRLGHTFTTLLLCAPARLADRNLEITVL